MVDSCRHTNYYSRDSYKKQVSLEIDNNGRSFVTLSDDTKKIQRIWVLGDSGNFNNAQQEVRKAMKTHLKGAHVDTWLMLGDNAYRSGSQKQYTKDFLTPIKRS